MHEITIGNPIKKPIEMWIDGFNSNISSIEFKPELHGFVVKKMDDIVLQNQKSTSPNPYGAPLSSEQWVSVKTNMCEKKKISLNVYVNSRQVVDAESWTSKSRQKDYMYGPVWDVICKLGLKAKIQ